MTPIISSTTKPGVQLSSPLLNISMLSMSSPISTIITPDSDITRYQETNYDILLRTQARQHGAMLREADYVLTRAISYPHWEKERAVPIWIIDPKLTKIREEYPSELPKLEVHNLLHLCDEDLAEHSKGFELHSARGRRGKVSWREFGYHICEFELHLYTITAHRPLPIPMSKMYVAVPDYLIAAEEMLEETNCCSLEQRFVPGEYGIRPPLRPWEKRKSWKHPAEREISKFMNGEDDGFIEEWNEEYIDRMT
jgi:hypothetical protein